MSSLIGGRSGNRGTCAQCCRMEYDLISNNKIVNKDKYLHGIGRDDKAIDFVCKQGIVSKDAATGIMGKHAFSFVSGFWRVKEEMLLKDYIVNFIDIK